MADLLKFALNFRVTALTSYFSIAYLGIFLPVALIVYRILPQKLRRYFMLVASYGFFWLISGKLVAFLFLSTLSIYLCGLWLGQLQAKRSARAKELPKEEKKALKKRYLTYQRWVLFLAALINLGILLTLKYSAFFLSNVNALLHTMHASAVLPIPKFVMPIGISFYTMQAISYVFDVYHGVIKADRNFARLALFMSFFPQIVEGPICRYAQTAEQLWAAPQIKFANFTSGLQRILFGMMKKLVIADRLNPMITEVFKNYANYNGGVVALGAIAYTCQLYMDFSGTMDAVIGTAEIFGVTMPENFARPFFSKSISEFWKRWHITLGTWFKDYIFYPVTMSGPMKKLTSAARKKVGNHFGPLAAGAVALFCVWFCNGLWHGAAWSYIFFGMYHFVLILSGNMIEPLAGKVLKALHIERDHFPYRCFQIVRTTCLVVIGELFFRAEGLQAGLQMFGKMVTDFSFSTLNAQALEAFNLDFYDIAIVLFTVAVIFVISILNEKGQSIREWITHRPLVARWAILYAWILFVLIFGAYGHGYVSVDPIYANF